MPASVFMGSRGAWGGDWLLLCLAVRAEPQARGLADSAGRRPYVRPAEYNRTARDFSYSLRFHFGRRRQSYLWHAFARLAFGTGHGRRNHRRYRTTRHGTPFG